MTKTSNRVNAEEISEYSGKQWMAPPRLELTTQVAVGNHPGGFSLVYSIDSNAPP